VKERSLAVSTSVSPRVSQMQQQVQSEITLPLLSAPRVILRRLRLFAGGAFCFRRTREVSRRRIVVPGLSRGPWRAQARNQQGGGGHRVSTRARVLSTHRTMFTSFVLS
jgi:hypothetical protein